MFPRFKALESSSRIEKCPCYYSKQTRSPTKRQASGTTTTPQNSRLWTDKGVPTREWWPEENGKASVSEEKEKLQKTHEWYRAGEERSVEGPGKRQLKTF